MLRRKRHDQQGLRDFFETHREENSETGVREALDALKQKDRAILLMHHSDGYTVSEIAQQLHTSEDVVKMRLYRARRRLRIFLISILLLAIFAAAAVGAGLLDVRWFLLNRRSSQVEFKYTDFGSVENISYSGRYLSAEFTDAKWDMNHLELLLTYSLTGTHQEALTVYQGNIGVDGIRHDCIWLNDQIMSVEQWADGKPVYTYYLDGWTIQGMFLNGSEDALMDGSGDSFMAAFSLDHLSAADYASHLIDGRLRLENRIIVKDYTSNEILEEGTLCVWVDAPRAEDWRLDYEESML